MSAALASLTTADFGNLEFVSMDQAVSEVGAWRYPGIYASL
jgi:hypothetical protein